MHKSTVFKNSEFQYEKLSGAVHNCEIARLVTPEFSEGLEAGVINLDKCSFDWMLTYDEILYVLEGHLRVVVNEENLDCDKGDAVWFPRDTPLRFEVDEKAVCFYAVYPGSAIRWDLVGVPPLPPKSASR